MSPDTSRYLDFRGWYMKWSAKMRQRDPTFAVCLNWLMQTGGKRLIETGSFRDAGSTELFGDFCSRIGAHLWTVDINDKVIAVSKSRTAEYASCISYVHSDSVEFLRSFDQTIDFLYLDSGDYDRSNPLPAQRFHLREFEAALPKLNPRACVLIDDNEPKGGGKGELVRAPLMENGFICLLDAYQSAWVRPWK